MMSYIESLQAELNVRNGEYDYLQKKMLWADRDRNDSNVSSWGGFDKDHPDEFFKGHGASSRRRGNELEE